MSTKRLESLDLDALDNVTGGLDFGGIPSFNIPSIPTPSIPTPSIPTIPSFPQIGNVLSGLGSLASGAAIANSLLNAGHSGVGAGVPVPEQPHVGTGLVTAGGAPILSGPSFVPSFTNGPDPFFNKGAAPPVADSDPFGAFDPFAPGAPKIHV